MAGALGRPLMPWQREAADVLNEYVLDDAGALRFVYSRAALIVPRRAGKTILTLSQHLQRLTMQRDRKGWYTAQTREDAATYFRDDLAPVVRASALDKLFRCRMSNGSESISFRTSASMATFNLFAPNATALHGKDADDVTCDEAWAFDLARGTAIEAGVRPAMLTRPARQLMIISAAGNDGSTWLASWRARGQAGARGLYYLEYSADPATDDLDDPATWARVHPAVGYTITTADLAAERDDMPRREWLRSILNVWAGAPGADPVIPLASWDAAAGDYETGQPPTLGLAVAPDGAAAAIGSAWRADSGRLWVEVIDHRPGTGWVADRLEQVSRDARARVAVDRHGPAGPIADELRHRRIPLDILTMDDYATACAALLLDATENLPGDGLARPRPRLGHAAQPVLDAAVRVAGRRPLGERWAWARKSGDISALEAVTVAAWGARRRRFTRPTIG